MLCNGVGCHAKVVGTPEGDIGGVYIGVGISVGISIGVGVN